MSETDSPAPPPGDAPPEPVATQEGPSRSEPDDGPAPAREPSAGDHGPAPEIPALPPGPSAPPRRFPALPAYVERIALVLALVLGFLFVWTTIGEVYRNFRWKPRVDFTMYHAAAQTATAGENLYTFHQPGGYRPHNLPYPYPPLLASMLAPLGKLTLAWAYHLWVALMVGCLGLLTWLSVRVTAASGARRPLLLGLGALFLSMILVDSNVYWGQVNILVMTLVAAGVLLWTRGRSGWAGAFIGAAAALKVLPAAVALFFLFRRDWRALGASVVSAIGLLAVVPSLAGGPSWAWAMGKEWLDLFFSALTQGSQGLQAGGGYDTQPKNGSIVATLDRIFGGAGLKPMFVSLPQPAIDSIGKVLRLTVVVSSVAAAARVCRPRTAAIERHVFPLAASMLVLVGWLYNMILWDHHTIGLVLILPVVATAALDEEIDPLWRRALWIGLVAGAAGLGSGWFSGSRRWGLQTLCLLILWAGITWALIHAGPPKPPAAAEETLEPPTESPPEGDSDHGPQEDRQLPLLLS